jgi:hypothetical protein
MEEARAELELADHDPTYVVVDARVRGGEAFACNVVDGGQDVVVLVVGYLDRESRFFSRSAVVRAELRDDAPASGPAQVPRTVGAYRILERYDLAVSREGFFAGATRGEESRCAAVARCRSSRELAMVMTWGT